MPTQMHIKQVVHLIENTLVIFVCFWATLSSDGDLKWQDPPQRLNIGPWLTPLQKLHGFASF